MQNHQKLIIALLPGLLLGVCVVVGLSQLTMRTVINPVEKCHPVVGGDVLNYTLKHGTTTIVGGPYTIPAGAVGIACVSFKEP